MVPKLCVLGDRTLRWTGRYTSQKILAKLLKPYQERLNAKNISMNGGGVQSIISKYKAKGLTADDVLALVAENNKLSPKERLKRVMEKKGEFLDGDLGEMLGALYKEYERTLRESNSLDFDDLLVFGVKMFSAVKRASNWCQHILVDE